jgi:hypothetical protein
MSRYGTTKKLGSGEIHMFKLLNVTKVWLKISIDQFSYWDFAQKRAIVDFYKIQNDKLTANLIDNTSVAKNKKSSVAVNIFFFCGNLTRNNLNFYHFEKE